MHAVSYPGLHHCCNLCVSPTIIHMMWVTPFTVCSLRLPVFLFRQQSLAVYYFTITFGSHHCCTQFRQQSLAVYCSLLFSGRTTVAPNFASNPWRFTFHYYFRVAHCCTHTLGYTKLHQFFFSDIEKLYMFSKISLTSLLCIIILLAPRDIRKLFPTSDHPGTSLLYFISWHLNIMTCCMCMTSYPGLHHCCTSVCLPISYTWCGLHPLQSAAFGCQCYILLRQQSLAVIIHYYFQVAPLLHPHSWVHQVTPVRLFRYVF